MYILTKWGKRELLTDKENGILLDLKIPKSAADAGPLRQKAAASAHGVYG